MPKIDWTYELLVILVQVIVLIFLLDVLMKWLGIEPLLYRWFS